MYSERSGYWANGQVSEICGELIDSDHTAVLGLADRFGVPVADLLAAEPPGSTTTYWSSAAATASSRPTRTSSLCARR